MLDIRKNEIKPGARVAYNRSGYMASGLVKEIRKRFHMRQPWPTSVFRIYILNDQDGTVSKVKDKRSVLVINEQHPETIAALKFYASKENWVDDVLGMPDGYSSEVTGSNEINQDGGMKAREALKHYETPTR